MKPTTRFSPPSREQPPEHVCPGIYTTEMWGKTIVQLILLANSIFNLGIDITDETAIAIAGALEAVYAISRGIVKRTASVQIQTALTSQQTALQTDRMIAAVSAAIRYQANTPAPTPPPTPTVTTTP